MTRSSRALRARCPCLLLPFPALTLLLFLLQTIIPCCNHHNPLSLTTNHPFFIILTSTPDYQPQTPFTSSHRPPSTSSHSHATMSAPATTVVPASEAPPTTTVVAAEPAATDAAPKRSTTDKILGRKKTQIADPERQDSVISEKLRSKKKWIAGGLAGTLLSLAGLMALLTTWVSRPSSLLTLMNPRTCTDSASTMQLFLTSWVMPRLGCVLNGYQSQCMFHRADML